MTGGVGAAAWLAVSVALFVIEGITVQLFCVWFAVGALFAMGAAAVGAPVVIQLLVFLLTSFAVLFPGRRIVKNRLLRERVATNADQVIGQTGVVKEEIDNLKQTGRVTANGLDWTARTLRDGDTIPVESLVRVLRIEGVKLIVESLPEHGKE